MAEIRDRIVSARFLAPPPPWGEGKGFAVGGLTSVGFARGADLLLVTSSAGRGVFDCLKGERMARDPADGDFEDIHELEAEGIGPLAGQRVRMSGLFGGGLPGLTSDGWSVEWLTPDWPDDVILLLPPGCSIYDHRPERTTFYKVDPGVTEVRAWGFSATGRTLLLATSSDITIWVRQAPSA